jgi:hypothetical protein
MKNILLVTFIGILLLSGIDTVAFNKDVTLINNEIRAPPL